MTDDTPNPDVKKFNVGRDVCGMGIVKDYTNAEAAQDSELAQSLFAHEHIKAVMFGSNFISVTKIDDANWETLRLDVIDIITDHFLAEKPVFIHDITTTTEHHYDEADQEIVTQILDLIETKIRPAVAQDGGDITFHGFSKGIVYLKMQGACAGCPSSAVTLKSGIENMLRHYIPEVLEVESA
ncbi:MAG: Fe-S cluster biogenesis protein NfuA [Alphaproteobacteria bacterium]|jgi:Fe-S cluster biogenesis protein NfuA